MALIKWNEQLSVGIESIDKQHQVLVSMINEFYDNISNRSSRELISELIAKMKDYTVFHFNYEENIFKKHNYIKTDAHKKEHDDFVAKVLDLEDRYNNGGLVVSFEITTFLKKWLIDHIQGTDKEYSDFLIAKGVK
jgi:hemerythrin-like metal-binding protein